MDNREAKFILSAYRPASQDAADPRFSEALEQTQRDPILRRWFEESIVFDAAVTEKFSNIEVPNDLRESILVGARVSRPAPAAPLKWAIAACIVLFAIAGALVVQQNTKLHLAGWQEEGLRTISALVAGQSKFDAESHVGADLIRWLKTNGGLTSEKLPKNFERLESLGCKTFPWKGTPVSVICFMRLDGGLIHLVAARASFDQAEGEPQFLQRGEWATATWREGEMIYMLALEGSPDQLRSYLP
jgi:hypothetical protein